MELYLIRKISFVHSVSVAHPASIPSVSELLPPGKAAVEPSSGAEVKNKWNCTLLPLYAFMPCTGKTSPFFNFFWISVNIGLLFSLSLFSLPSKNDERKTIKPFAVAVTFKRVSGVA